MPRVGVEMLLLSHLPSDGRGCLISHIGQCSECSRFYKSLKKQNVVRGYFKIEVCLPYLSQCLMIQASSRTYYNAAFR